LVGMFISLTVKRLVSTCPGHGQFVFVATPLVISSLLSPK
jgi:hypothetical protein